MIHMPKNEIWQHADISTTIKAYKLPLQLVMPKALALALHLTASMV